MIDEGMRKAVEILAWEELQRANKTSSQFNSPHEGYSVLLEECEESNEEMEKINCKLRNIWGSVRNDKNCINDLLDIERISIELALEAIQVSAMAQKFIDMYHNQRPIPSETGKDKRL